MLYTSDKDRKLRLADAAAAWEAEIAAARPDPRGVRQSAYPAATRRAVRAWDTALGQNFGGRP